MRGAWLRTAQKPPIEVWRYRCAGFVGGPNCPGVVWREGDLCERTDHDVWSAAELADIDRRAEKWLQLFADD